VNLKGSRRRKEADFGAKTLSTKFPTKFPTEEMRQTRRMSKLRRPPLADATRGQGCPRSERDQKFSFCGLGDD